MFKVDGQFAGQDAYIVDMVIRLSRFIVASELQAYGIPPTAYELKFIQVNSTADQPASAEATSLVTGTIKFTNFSFHDRDEDGNHRNITDIVKDRIHERIENILGLLHIPATLTVS